MSDVDKAAADHVRQVTSSAMELADKLLHDLDDRSGFSINDDVRDIIRPAWITLIAGHLVDRPLGRSPDLRFSRPVICAWCNNRHRSVVPFKAGRQGDACAASVFQVTEEFLVRARAAQTSRRRSPGLKVLARAATIPLGTWLVQGHYGSTSYDDLFRFVQNAPTDPANPVCDNCIGERHAAGDLEKIEGNYP